MAYDQYGNFVPNPVTNQFGQPFAGQQLPVQNTTPVMAPQQQGYQPMQMPAQGPDYGASALADALRANTTGDMKGKDFGQRFDAKMNKLYDIGNKAGAMYDKIGNFFS